MTDEDEGAIIDRVISGDVNSLPTTILLLATEGSIDENVRRFGSPAAQRIDGTFFQIRS